MSQKIVLSPALPLALSYGGETGQFFSCHKKSVLGLILGQV